MRINSIRLVSLFACVLLRYSTAYNFCGSLGLGDDNAIREIFRESIHKSMGAEGDIFELSDDGQVQCVPPRVFLGLSDEEWRAVFSFTEIVLKADNLKTIAPNAFLTRGSLSNVRVFFIPRALSLMELPNDLLHYMPNVNLVEISNTGIADLPDGFLDHSPRVFELILESNQNLLTIPKALSVLPDYDYLSFFDCRQLDFAFPSPLQGKSVSSISVFGTKMDEVGFLSREMLGLNDNL